MTTFIENHPYATILISLLLIAGIFLAGVIVSKKMQITIGTPTIGTAWYRDRKIWQIVASVIFAIFILEYVLSGFFWGIIWDRGLFFFCVIVLGLAMLFSFKSGKGWIIFAIAILLLTNIPRKTGNEIRAAQVASEAAPIDTTIKLSGNDFYFQIGPYMDYDIRAMTTGKGFWWENEAVVYFETPSGKVFRVDEEGRATALHPDSGSTEDVAFGLFRVWGTGSVAITTSWQDPEEQAKLVSN